ncbi:DUF2760 domain-containing protein [Stieleria varia]|uniref:DUF2760 domain-containing protein n=1 Tax=Stieleria varia TaxID=2528005 RepID=A0A5C6AZC2_9BACT|nr:DUF2760 domain-containing protein [Stieleria varia]TWU04837.1 hypothetical protein Pla52n_28820 [Stieleria varia]
MGLGIAIRAFSAGLFNKQAAERLRIALDGGQPADEPSKPKIEPPASVKPPATPPQPKRPARSEAVTLLSALQRESRLIDLIQENLGDYSDAQVGAAARPCLLQCKSTLDRLIGLAPVSDAGEGNSVDVGENPSAARYQWVGEGSGGSGKLIHKGWVATKTELPEWTGDDADANVIAPAQLQRS